MKIILLDFVGIICFKFKGSWLWDYKMNLKLFKKIFSDLFYIFVDIIFWSIFFCCVYLYVVIVDMVNILRVLVLENLVILLLNIESNVNESKIISLLWVILV